MTVTVRLAAALRSHAGGVGHVELDLAPPITVAAALDALAAAYPSVGRRLRDERGALRQHVNVFVGSDNARDLDGLDTQIPDGTELSVLPAVSGGC